MVIRLVKDGVHRLFDVNDAEGINKFTELGYTPVKDSAGNIKFEEPTVNTSINTVTNHEIAEAIAKARIAKPAVTAAQAAKSVTETVTNK